MINRRFGKLFTLYCNAGLFWFRIPSISWWGFYVKNLKKHPFFFSERYGYTKGLKLGHYYIGFLPFR